MKFLDRLQTRFRSKFINVLASERYLKFRRRTAILGRTLRGEGRVVHYFHQVDDPHCHLIVQKLDKLKSTYNIPFRFHLVPKPISEFQGNVKRFTSWGIHDVKNIANGYKVMFPPVEKGYFPSLNAINAANDVLAKNINDPKIAEYALHASESLWLGKIPTVDDGAVIGGKSTDTLLGEGQALRSKLGHYYSGMFHYEGEWFWGIDRIRFLEERLCKDGLRNDCSSDQEFVVPEPTPASATTVIAPNNNAKDIELEYFCSLRSPYTAIGHARVMDLIQRSGVTARIRPVMPMVMRGVPAPSAKAIYIVMDAARIARSNHIPFGNVVDPLGIPVQRAMEFYYVSKSFNRGDEFITSYLSAAWAEGIDITSGVGLKTIIERIGLDWEKVSNKVGTKQLESDGDTKQMLENNINELLDAGIWGVPSFRITGGKKNNNNDDDPFICWGQDRIWLVENEIARRIAATS